MVEAQRGGINRIRAVNQGSGSPFILLIPTLVAWAWDNNHPKLRWSKKHKPRVEYISCRGDVTECPEELFFFFFLSLKGDVLLDYSHCQKTQLLSGFVR